MDVESTKEAVVDIEKRSYFKDEARDLYNQGKLKNGEIFTIKGASDGRNSFWVAGVYMYGKLSYVKYKGNSSNLDSLKAKGVRALMEIVKRGWADTRQAPWLPPRVQSLQDPNKVIYGSKSNETVEKVLGDGKEKTLMVEDKLIADLESVQPDVA